MVEGVRRGRASSSLSAFLFRIHPKATLRFWPPLFSVFPLSPGLHWYKPCRPTGKAPDAVSGDGTVIFLV